MALLGKVHDFSSALRVEGVHMARCRVIASIIIPPVGRFLAGGVWLGILAQYPAHTVGLHSWACPCHLVIARDDSTGVPASLLW